jgi:hypothetical protein
MIVKLDPGAMRETVWSEYATRFLFGGIVTLLAGVVADKFGPVIGGLFLAFPAIFPATASLIAKHQRKEKAQEGMSGKKRGRLAAGVDAAGASMGCWGLAAFGVVAWKLLPRFALWETLILASGAWAIVAVMVWVALRRLR